jgi:hypothetical protein
MTLSHLEIRDYQSLGHLRLALGGFTVITGETGAGKSAVIRAVRLLAFNARGTSYIRHGARTAVVGLGIREVREDPGMAWSVGISRGGRGQDSYHLGPPGDGPVQSFTKLGGSVPEAVSAALRLTTLNFSSQFDRPFLLDASAGEVARTLGALTNVSLVFRAAQLAQARKNGILARLRVRQADVERLRAQAALFARLAARREAVERAEAALERLRDVSGHASRLRALLGALDSAERSLASVRAVPEPPSLLHLTELAQRAQHLRGLLHSLDTAETQHSSYAAVAQEKLAQSASSDAQLRDFLAECGTCPVCGQQVPAS